MPVITIGKHTPASIAAVLKRLEDVQNSLEALSGLLERYEVAQLDIKYQAEAMKGLAKLEKFAQSGFDQLTKFRGHRGDFGVIARSGSVPARAGMVPTKRVKKAKRTQTNGEA